MGLDECDDENNYDMDGCDEDCYVEDGWYCYGGTHSSPDSCYETCGDGYHYYYE
jgi:cysteine-rich repeat protein